MIGHSRVAVVVVDGDHRWRVYVYPKQGTGPRAATVRFQGVRPCVGSDQCAVCRAGRGCVDCEYPGAVVAVAGEVSGGRAASQVTVSVTPLLGATGGTAVTGGNPRAR